MIVTLKGILILATIGVVFVTPVVIAAVAGPLFPPAAPGAAEEPAKGVISRVDRLMKEGGADPAGERAAAAPAQ